jgi:RNA polymerase-binding transcription factor DksA
MRRSRRGKTRPESETNEPAYCVSCGEVIPPRRLEAVPGTKTCVDCSEVPRKKRSDLKGDHFVQHTGGLHEKYLHEEDAEMDRKHRDE